MYWRLTQKQTIRRHGWWKMYDTDIKARTFKLSNLHHGLATTINKRLFEPLPLSYLSKLEDYIVFMLLSK